MTNAPTLPPSYRPANAENGAPARCTTAYVRRSALAHCFLRLHTDAASEGLNLQRLGTLINLDLPWNPTRLEQRRGRIQRIGQPRDEVFVYNMRYGGSVEDRMHQKLSDRLKQINDLFGQLPDTLEAVWIDIARRNEEEADKRIEEVPDEHPFIDKYYRVANVDWESCSVVLDAQTQLDALMRSWDGRKM